MSARVPVEIAFLDVAHGDTIVVSIPSTAEAVVIDCIDAEAVLTHLKNREIRHLRAVILTHLHLDHYRDAVRLLTQCEAELQIRCEHLYFTWEWKGASKKLRDQLLVDQDRHSDAAASAARPALQRQTAIRQLTDWVETNLDRAEPLTRTTRHEPFPGGFADSLQLLQPWHGHLGKLAQHGLNNASGVLKVQGVGSSALLTGDIEQEAWATLVQACGADLQADVMKWPHHGAWLPGAGAAGAILDHVRPAYVVISAGTDGARYDHPNDGVFEAIRERAPDVRLLCTQATPKCGTVDAAKRLQVLPLLEVEAARIGHKRVGSSAGCPCAGTVVVALGETAQVVQPSVQYHRDKIIGTAYPLNHQCSLFSRLDEHPSLECNSLAAEYPVASAIQIEP